MKESNEGLKVVNKVMSINCIEFSWIIKVKETCAQISAAFFQYGDCDELVILMNFRR